MRVYAATRLIVLTATIATGLAANAPACALPAAAAAASTANSAEPGAKVVSGSQITDPMFGIRVRAIGLQRRVELRQWQVDAGAPGGFAQVWSVEHIRTPPADAAHANPAQFPIDGQRWWSSDPRLEGKPVAAEVLTAIALAADAGNGWTLLKPDSLQLPPNLAATFQSDGDGLSTSQDPAHPQVGDVRVRWSMLTDATAPAGLRLTDGRWQMPEAALPLSPASASPPPETSPRPDAGGTGWMQGWFGGRLGLVWPIGLALLGVLAAVIVGLGWRRRR